MTNTQIRKIKLDPRALANPSWVTFDSPIGRWLLTRKGLIGLRSFLKRVLAVTRPTGFLFHRALPSVHFPWRRRTVTVLSANLWHDWPRHRQQAERLEAFAQLSDQEHADIILLQEVSRTPDLRADEWLADRLGMAYVYCRANGHEKSVGFEEGLAVFSRFPLAEPGIFHLRPKPFQFVRRLALGATVKLPIGDLPVFSVHLGHGRRRNSEQLADLRSRVAAALRGRAALIGGDFNAHESTPQLRQVNGSWIDLFRHFNPSADGTTFELFWPWGSPIFRHRFDYLFLSPGQQQWDLVEARHISTPGLRHSDHRAVIARLAPLSDRPRR